MPLPRGVDQFLDAVFGLRFPRWDAFMVLLAGADAVALLLRRELDLPRAWEDGILLADYALIAFFALEFVVSLARAEGRGRFVRANFYDLIGLVPLPIAFLRALRLLRVPHVLVWGSRFPHVADRLYGGAYALTIFKRYEPVIVEDLTDPLLVRVLQVLRAAVAEGRYAQSIGENLDRRRDRIHDVVLRSLSEKPALRMLLAAPGAEAALSAIQDQLVDVVVATLTDPELDAVLKESIDASLAELQARIAARPQEAVPASVA